MEDEKFINLSIIDHYTLYSNKKVLCIGASRYHQNLARSAFQLGFNHNLTSLNFIPRCSSEFSGHSGLIYW